MNIRVSFFLSLFLLTNLACNSKAYRPSKMKVGEVRTISGMSLTEYRKQPPVLRKNILLLLNKGGQHLNVNWDFSIDMFKSDTDKSPVRTFASAELRQMHEKTHCSVELKNYLIAQVGSGYVLFCNEALKIDEFNYFKLHYEGKTKEATGLNIFLSNADDDLVAGSLFFN